MKKHYQLITEIALIRTAMQHEMQHADDTIFQASVVIRALFFFINIFLLFLLTIRNEYDIL